MKFQNQFGWILICLCVRYSIQFFYYTICSSSPDDIFTADYTAVQVIVLMDFLRLFPLLLLFSNYYIRHPSAALWQLDEPNSCFFISHYYIFRLLFCIRICFFSIVVILSSTGFMTLLYCCWQVHTYNFSKYTKSVLAKICCLFFCSFSQLVIFCLAFLSI